MITDRALAPYAIETHPETAGLARSDARKHRDADALAQRIVDFGAEDEPREGNPDPTARFLLKQSGTAPGAIQNGQSTSADSGPDAR